MDHPTPTLDKPPSFLERLIARPVLLAGVALAGLLLVGLSVALLWRSGGDAKPVPPEFVTPPTLEDLALTYPELSDLLTDPAIGSVYKDFFLAYEEGGVEAAEELARQRGLLNDRDEIRITLVVDSESNVQPIVDELQRVGITVEGSYRDRINVGVPMALIQQLAEQQGTQALFEQLTQMEHIIRLELTTYNSSQSGQGIEGEGVALTGAEAWHAAGAMGQSIRIGVLDMGFDGYRGLLGSELPNSVTAASFVYGEEPDESGTDHGTACAEVVHEMAPEAELFLAYYDGSFVSMGQAVDWLLEQGVHIISNSTGGEVGPKDGTGEQAQMVDRVADQGVLWVNSAGNAGDEHYRGEYNDTDGDGLHEFPDGTESIALYIYAPQVQLVLNWDDWERVTEDYDFYVYDEESELIASAQDVQDGGPEQIPAEFLMGADMTEGYYYLMIKGHSVSRSGILDLFTVGAQPEFMVPDHSLDTPGDARGALAVGAAESSDDSLAVYSSQGPTNDGRLKPEISAPTTISGASKGPGGFNGTSAATPHVAGAAALVWSAFPQWTSDQVRNYLLDNALDLGPPGPDNAFGYGRLRLPDPPEGGLAQVPTPEPQPLPTLIPQATVVSVVPEPVDMETEGSGLGVMAVVLVGGSALCGGAVVLGAGMLLLVAVLRTRQRSAAEAEFTSAIESAPKLDHASLVGDSFPRTRLRDGVTTLGRSGDNDIVLDNPKVSRYHARFEQSSEGCTVEDLRSANGVRVNGRRVSRAVLMPGNRVRFGDVELVYLAAAQPPPRPGGPAKGEKGASIEAGGRRYPLLSTGALIGRSSTCDICLADELVSRQHARIEVEAGRYVITDLDSSGGTFVNGARIERQRLRDGDEIRVGDARLRFRNPKGH